MFATNIKKCPIEFCVPYFTMTEVGKMNLVLVGSVNIYIVNVGSKVIISG